MRELPERGVLTGMKPEIGIHGLAVVCEVIDLVCGGCDDAEIEARSSHTPKEVRVAGRRNVEKGASTRYHPDGQKGIELETVQPTVVSNAPA